MSGAAPILYVTANGVGNAWVPAQVLGLRARGLDVELVALRPPDQAYSREPAVQALAAETRRVYPLRAGRLVRALARRRLRRRLGPALGAALRPGEPTPVGQRLRLVAQVLAALDLVAGLARRPAHVHADMAHAPASVALFAAILLDTGFSFTGHANDLFPQRVALRRKLRAARFVVAISSFHERLYRENGAPPHAVVAIPVGVRVEALPFLARSEAAVEAPRVLAVGRLVPKKGFETLIDACALLARGGRRFRVEIAGAGPLLERLRQQAARAGVADRVALSGRPLLQEELSDFLARGQVFCLPCVPAPDGDVDGLPLVLLEAACTGLALVSTRLAGIPDLVEDGVTGLLAEPGDASGLADALARLLEAPALRGRLAAAARRRVEERFDARRALDRLAACLRAACETGRAPAADDAC